jgi:shikimate dehydrogenase
MLHRAAYEALSLPWTYEPYDVTVEQFAAFVGELDETWAGISITMPLKVEALRHVDQADPVALALGVINTIVVEVSGQGHRLVGANTDVYGVRTALTEAGVTGVEHAVLLGSGATATSAMAALLEMGCGAPVVVARSMPEADGLLAAAAAIGATPEVMSLEEIPLRDAAAIAAEADVVMSTIPMEAGVTLGEHLAHVKPDAVLLDAIYDPLVTPLSLAWEHAGGRAVSGVRMLLHQAARQVRLMTGLNPPVAAMDEVLVSHLST